ncbi:MAG: DnaJ domain-containing protein [Pseudomonadota bacterium]
MFDSNTNFRSKRETPVSVKLSSGESFDGIVFLRLDERLVDMMNDPRTFIPVKRSNGSTVIVAKSAIESLLEAEEQTGDASISETVPTPSSPDEPEPSISECDVVEEDHTHDQEGQAAIEYEASHEEGQSGPSRNINADDPPSDGDEELPLEAEDDEPNGTTSDDTETLHPRLISAYRALKVDPDASDEDIKAAFKARIKAVHPDALVGAEEGKKDAALHATKLINRAYDAVMKERSNRQNFYVDAAEVDG